MKWRHVFSVAPMMEVPYLPLFSFPLFRKLTVFIQYTDVYQRYFMRLLSKRAVLYTEMVCRYIYTPILSHHEMLDLQVTANTLFRVPEDQIERYLAADFNIENPVVLQLGGSDVRQMYTASKIATQYGYSEINLNVGCPSEKVAGKGCFGAALMLDPQLVSDLCQSISEASGQAATVKCRIGVNDIDSFEYLQRFIDYVHRKASVQHFIIHARKAILDRNFSPDDNRKIPPLKYDYVYQLVQVFPQLNFTINGGILNYDDIRNHLQQGKGAYYPFDY